MILQLFAGENQTLIYDWNAFASPDRPFQLEHCRAGKALEDDSFAGQSLDEDLVGSPVWRHGLVEGGEHPLMGSGSISSSSLLILT